MMQNKALVVIDLQNDITKNYREIIDAVNAAIEWAEKQQLNNRLHAYLNKDNFVFHEHCQNTKCVL